MAFRYVTFIPPVAPQPYVHTWTERVALLGNLENFVFSGGDSTPDWIPSEEEHFYQAAYCSRERSGLGYPLTQKIPMLFTDQANVRNLLFYNSCTLIVNLP